MEMVDLIDREQPEPIVCLAGHDRARALLPGVDVSGHAQHISGFVISDEPERLEWWGTEWEKTNILQIA